MSNVIKLAKLIAIKRADDPQIPQWNEVGEESPQNPMMFDESITSPDDEKQKENPLADLIRAELNSAMASIRSDYETLKNVPGALLKTPNDVIEAFFKIWNDVQSLQIDEKTEPLMAGFQFVNLISNMKYSGIKTPTSPKSLTISQIVFAMNKAISDSVSEFYSGKFVPEMHFAEELSASANEISKAISTGTI